MTQTEALRLALEALERIIATCLDPYSHEQVRSRPEHFINQAINAIKAALEAKDEPVACKECHLKDTVYDLLDDLKVANLKLSVQSQRTWVGLTYEDMVALQKDLYNAKGESVLPTTFAMAVEAKLKEKNT
jgi:deoxyribodipyrimidine photolyase